MMLLLRATVSTAWVLTRVFSGMAGGKGTMGMALMLSGNAGIGGTNGFSVESSGVTILGTPLWVVASAGPAVGKVARLNSRVEVLPAKSQATTRIMPVMAACPGMQKV